MIYVEKSQPAPTCLAAEKAKPSGTYRTEEVLVRNKRDFRNKCYICGFKNPTTIHTEHFKPHGNDLDLKFDWNNLFYACGHCNISKSSNFDNILNCTKLSDQVDTQIQSVIFPFPKEKPIFTARSDDTKTLETVKLLNKVFNGTTITTRLEAANLRDALLNEIKIFQNYFEIFYDDNSIPSEREEARQKIIKALRPTSNFTAFKHWIVKNNPDYLVEFGESCTYY